MSQEVSNNPLDLVNRPIAKEILDTLADGESSVSELAQRLDLDVDTISRYLSRLRRADLVTYRARHRWHFYRLTDRVRLRITDREEVIEVTTPQGDLVSISWKRRPEP